MHSARKVKLARKALRLAAVALVALGLVLAVAACGSKSGGSKSGGGKSGGGKAGGSTSGSSPTVRHVTSSPARALLGHWKDNLGMDQYFNGKQWFTKSPGGDIWSYRYKVVSQDPAKHAVKTDTYLMVGGETLDMQEVTFTFANHACTKLVWSMASGPSATYVDGHTQP
jgi:hypothetical protein